MRNAFNFSRVLAVVGAFIMLTAEPAATAPLVIVALGDSLTAGTGLDHPELAFPARLQVALDAVGVAADVRNAGVGGDTSAGGLARLHWSVANDADLVIIELGANDALRGLDPEITYANLDAIVVGLRERGIGVLLAGMLAPPNMGREYGEAFRSAYERIAATHGIAFYPFFLEGVAAELNYLQRDGMHPNAAGVEIIVGRILPTVLEALSALEQMN